MVTIVGVITGDLPRQIRQSGISGMKKFAGNISESVFQFSPVEFYLKLWALPSLIRLLSGSLGPQDGNILKMLMINLRWEERKKEIKRRALCVFPPVLSSQLVGSYLTRRGSALLSLSCLLHLLCQFDRTLLETPGWCYWRVRHQPS